jgi:hypothetical protein
MPSSIGARSAQRLIMLVAASWMTACNGSPTGPSLANVSVSDVRLQPTEGNAALCCCRVAAVAENRNDVPVHVTVKFFAYDQDPSFPLTAIVHFIRSMQPGRREPILASGFLLACSRIADVRVEVDVNGTSALP